MLSLITQSEEIMDELAEIEGKFLENWIKTKIYTSKLILHPSIMDTDGIERELASDKPFADYLGDRDLLVTNHLECLSTKNRMILFAESHDRIFGTEWIKIMRSMRRKGYEI